MYIKRFKIAIEYQNSQEISRGRKYEEKKVPN
jgi:hypothetical protein